ncbi:hypothetical protein PWT90_00313 [Aphanocladium album]|nr:hypothetical protein PWT90_00313 [Aphanocladium album]
MVLLSSLINIVVFCPLLIQPSLAAITGRYANVTMNRLIPPTKDPWYRAPDNFAAAQRGDVMKVRRAPGDLRKKLKNLKAHDQILYRTSNAAGDPSWAVTTVLAPKVPDPTWPSAVSYQMPYNTVNLDESPSYLLSTVSTDIRYDALDRMLERGWVVIIPDYQGPNAIFGAGKCAGRATLDSMRGFHSVCMSRYGLAYEKLSFIAWGYSGGALASAWAYLQKPEYAAPLSKPLQSYVIGGLPADLPETILGLDGTENTGIALSLISGLMQEYRQVNGTIQLAAKTAGPFNVTVFDAVRTQTQTETMAAYAYHNLSDYFEGGINRVMSQLRKTGFEKDLSLRAKMPPVIPQDQNQNFLFYHGVQDRIASIGHVEHLLRKTWCKHKNVIELQRNHEGGHLEAGDAGIDAALEWIARRILDLSKTFALEKVYPEDQKIYYKNEQCYFHDVAAQGTYSEMDGYLDEESGGS